MPYVAYLMGPVRDSSNLSLVPGRVRTMVRIRTALSVSTVIIPETAAADLGMMSTSAIRTDTCSSVAERKALHAQLDQEHTFSSVWSQKFYTHITHSLGVFMHVI